MTYTLHHGDAADLLPLTADVLICDPPAAIGFMGAAWDGDKGGRAAWVAWLAGILKKAGGGLPPGACGLVWALPRTSHWTALACEEAGYTVVDRIAHIFGSGFPKHKHALKPAVEDWWLIQKPGAARRLNVDACRVETGDPFGGGRKMSSSGSTLGKFGEYERDGWMPGSPTGRWPPHLVLSHAPDCERVGVKRVRGYTSGDSTTSIGGSGAYGGGTARLRADKPLYADADGMEAVEDWRCVEGCPVAELGRQSGELKSGERKIGTPRNGQTMHLPGLSQSSSVRDFASSAGTAARFFPNFYYCAKASRKERNAGCEGVEHKTVSRYGEQGQGPLPQQTPRVERAQANHHPTVKPQALMRWLVRLITPPGGIVLDPFCGSGSTGVAALAEGRGFVGIEQDAEYYAIAEARLRHAADPLHAMREAS